MWRETCRKDCVGRSNGGGGGDRRMDKRGFGEEK